MTCITFGDLCAFMIVIVGIISLFIGNDKK
jgi:hypothetical protein